MSGKPVLHYFNARGRMECIRWLLAAAGVEFEEKFIERPEDLEKIDMYAEGIADLSEMIGHLVVTPPDQKEAKISLIKDRTKNRYLPVFEKALKSRLSSLPNVKKFLQPGSQRKPPLDEKKIEEARKIFKL
ncbi:LOC101840807 [Phodopus roborovskii]|uniref:glutathione transferase n=1 Tax=Phodopus roborovskii TaxID=109678 RepID=A0AAU9ZV74_PHORO|nr:LOC101840807 [Phodopus roborovskii]